MPLCEKDMCAKVKQERSALEWFWYYLRFFINDIPIYNKFIITLA